MFNSGNQRKVDKKAVLAAEDEFLLEQFIVEEKAFVLSCAGKVFKRHVDGDSEEALTAIEAFVEAIRAYSYEKGGFLSFAETVIRRRLIDELRREKRHSSVIPMDPQDIGVEQEYRQAVDADADETIKDRIALEIERLGMVLAVYGFSFLDLAEASPKASKTKEACRNAVIFILSSPLLIQEMKVSGMLPIKVIEKNIGLPRKVLERHRKYIIAAAEILNGDYPCLSEYLGYIKRSCRL